MPSDELVTTSVRESRLVVSGRDEPNQEPAMLYVMEGPGVSGGENGHAARSDDCSASSGSRGPLDSVSSWSAEDGMLAPPAGTTAM
jgi:hypothetical protein